MATFNANGAIQQKLWFAAKIHGGVGDLHQITSHTKLKSFVSHPNTFHLSVVSLFQSRFKSKTPWCNLQWSRVF